MGKYFGNIGYRIDVVDPENPDISKTEITLVKKRGEVLKNSRRWQDTQESINPTMICSNRIKFIGNSFDYENLSSMIFVEYLGSRWKISDVDLSERPKIIVTLGGLYNENARSQNQS